MEIIRQYFPSLTSTQLKHYSELDSLYKEWNARINVISRKDIDFLCIRHILHSLSIAKFIRFIPGSNILDVGTGGGFPGIPLAIMFPESNFTLVDSIGKKIKVVNEISDSLGLMNVEVRHLRAENVPGEFDFAICRAVTKLPTIIGWIQKNIKRQSKHSITNGIIALKGGDLGTEVNVPYEVTIRPVSDYFKESFFETKKIVHVGLPWNYS